MKWVFSYNGEDFTDRVSSMTELKVYKKIVFNSNKETLRWYHDKVTREEICKSLDISDKTFYRVLTSLVKSDLLIKIQRATFRLNDKYVTYGR